MKSFLYLCAATIAAFACASQSVSASVNIYGETGSDGTNVTVHIYADLGTNSLVSFGVRLHYDASNLQLLAAAKNAAVWQLSDGRTIYPYADPDTSTAGEVILLGAKFDGLNPLQGVFGQHVLLGTVTFGRRSSAPPVFTLALGRPTNFNNFVTTSDTVLDASPGGIVLGDVVPLQMIGVTPGPSWVTVQWRGGTEATQYLQQRFSLGTDGQWDDIFTNPPPTATTVTYTNPIGTNRTMFYRVRVQP
ncbi:MAG: hypothetical protein NT154_18545 [Verrucomicrobia bacterium]|nr:hypothetical protein [Verrucomicrobiota bacterium]